MGGARFSPSTLFGRLERPGQNGISKPTLRSWSSSGTACRQQGMSAVAAEDVSPIATEGAPSVAAEDSSALQARDVRWSL